MPQSPEASTQTIAAIATARGRSALAVIRTSGPEALAVASRCFSTSLEAAQPNSAHFGYVVGADGRRIDQVVATVFRAPRSATGEDVVEFSCHGGDVAARLILDTLLASGARLADPGEFTQRAFLNGKIDLAQAEAVADLIHASSSLAHRVSLNQLTGQYSDALSNIRHELLGVAALIELELDFSEEDVEFADKDQLVELLTRAGSLVTTLLGSYRTGQLVRDGIRVVIGGKPNAGKSTLLNALVGFDRAIVSPTPGTTRDEIEAEAEINGMLFRFVDTAGLRTSADEIEAEGVRRAYRSLDAADVVLYVVDGTLPDDADERAFVRELRAKLSGLPLLVVANKADVAVDVRGSSESEGGERFGGTVLRLSAERGRTSREELSSLVDWLTAAVGMKLSDADSSPIVTNQRHRQHLQGAAEAIESAQRGLSQSIGGDVLSIDLRRALFEIGSITGEITNEDVLGQIFSRFCIGK